MATRFYFANTPADASLTPAYAAWDTTAHAFRLPLSEIQVAHGPANYACFNAEAVAANGTGLAVQLISRPLASGNLFSTSDTVKGVVSVFETPSTANINRQPLCLKVVSRDGTTLRATLLPLGHYGPATTEWDSVNNVNRRLAAGTALQSNYTTVAGDRLVLELGGQVDATGSANASGSLYIGVTIGPDLAENETDLNQIDNPWFELSRDLTFWAPPDDAGGCLLTILRGGR